jgi:glycosyltransferase involved in cell wall biosynthesis
MKQGMVSIVVPVYRVEQYLNQCIDSLLAQSYSNIEIILVDDCSDDNSGAICDSYAKANDLIKVIHLAKNSGQAAARNAGLAIIAGEYVAFVDSDDIVSHLYIEKFITAFDMAEVDVVQCGYKDVDEGFKIESISSSKSELENVKLFNNKEIVDCVYGSGDASLISFMLCNKMYKAKTIKEVIFAEGFKNEDVIFISELLMRGISLLSFDNIEYYYRQRTSSTMGTERANNYLLVKNHILSYSEVRRRYMGTDNRLSQLIEARLACWYLSAYKRGYISANSELSELLKNDNNQYKFYENHNLPLYKRAVLLIMGGVKIIIL